MHRGAAGASCGAAVWRASLSPGSACGGRNGAPAKRVVCSLLRAGSTGSGGRPRGFRGTGCARGARCGGARRARRSPGRRRACAGKRSAAARADLGGLHAGDDGDDLAARGAGKRAGGNLCGSEAHRYLSFSQRRFYFGERAARSAAHGDCSLASPHPNIGKPPKSPANS